MGSYRSQGPTCVTTSPAIDPGTLPRSRIGAPSPVGLGANSHLLHKRASGLRPTRAPGLSAADADKALTKALADALQLFEQRRKDLETWDEETQENFLAWFGTTEKTARTLILKRIDKAIAKLKRLTLRNFVPMRKKEEDYADSYAYVMQDDFDHGRYEMTVHIGPRFATANDVTRAGTLVHELSHFYTVGHTTDVEATFLGDPRPAKSREMYGYTKAQRLSMQNPHNALRNADNFEFFIEAHDPADHRLDLDGAGDFPSGPARL